MITEVLIYSGCCSNSGYRVILVYGVSVNIYIKKIKVNISL